MEAADLMVLVIKATGMILGKLVRDDSGVSGVSGVTNMSYFIQTSFITAASQALVEALELDIATDIVASKKIGNVLSAVLLKDSKET